MNFWRKTADLSGRIIRSYILSGVSVPQRAKRVRHWSQKPGGNLDPSLAGRTTRQSGKMTLNVIYDSHRKAVQNACHPCERLALLNRSLTVVTWIKSLRSRLILSDCVSRREELPTIYKCPHQGCTAVYRGADGMKVLSVSWNTCRLTLWGELTARVPPQKHIKEHHEEVRERPCPHPGCNKVFMIDRYLQRHVKLIHTGNAGPFSASSRVFPRTISHGPHPRTQNSVYFNF